MPQTEAERDTEETAASGSDEEDEDEDEDEEEDEEDEDEDEEDEDEEEEEEEPAMHPGQLMKVLSLRLSASLCVSPLSLSQSLCVSSVCLFPQVLALEIDKPAAKASKQPRETETERDTEKETESDPSPSKSESSCDSSSESSDSESERESDSSDSEDEVSLDQLRKVKMERDKERARAREREELMPPLTLPEIDEINTSLSDAERRFVEFGESELLSSQGVLVGDHCDTAVQALALHQVVTEATKKVLWFARNPSRLAQLLRQQFAPFAGFGVHTLQTLPLAGQAGVALHGGAVCCSYRDLVAMHKSETQKDTERDRERQLMRWLRADDSADVLLVFSSCDEVLSRSWKGVEENKWTQTGQAFHFMQQRLPLAGAVYTSSGTLSQTYGSILTVILHVNDVPCCCRSPHLRRSAGAHGPALCAVGEQRGRTERHRGGLLGGTRKVCRACTQRLPESAGQVAILGDCGPFGVCSALPTTATGGADGHTTTTEPPNRQACGRSRAS